MSEYLVAAFLGMVQGLTEFLPVSSSGHLVLFQEIFTALGHPLEGEHLFFDVLLHLGTLAVVLAFFRHELQQFVYEWTGLGARPVSTLPSNACKPWTFYLLLSTLITVAIALPLEDRIEAAFQSPIPVGAGLLLTGTLLGLTVLLERGRVPESGRDVTWWMAALVGLGQAVAVFPGVSRSGTTIAVALMLGMRRGEAVAYSFLLSIPAILGGALLQARKVEQFEWAAPLVGMATAALFGWIALRWLVNWVLRGKLMAFSYYCLFLGLLILGVSLFLL
jgi:undecaprenyl-diphosphatase